MNGVVIVLLLGTSKRWSGIFKVGVENSIKFCV